MGDCAPIIRPNYSNDSFGGRWKLDGAERRYRPASGSGAPGFASTRGREAKASRQPDARGRHAYPHAQRCEARGTRVRLWFDAKAGPEGVAA